MRTHLRAALTLAATTAVVATVTAAPAAAAGTVLTPGASAYAAAGATGTATLKANLQLAGSLGKLLDALISPIVSQDLNPLVGALQGATSGLVTSALGSASPYSAATNPAQTQVTTAPVNFPNDTLPSPCASTGSQPCYSGPSAGVNAAPLVTASVGVLNGYAEQVASSADATNSIFGRATTTNAKVSVLPSLSSLIPGLASVGNPLVSATSVASKARCPNDGAAGASKPTTAPTAFVSASGVSLLGGLVTFTVASGAIANLTVNSVSYASVLALPTVSVAGVTISPFGSAVMVSIPLTLTQVLGALGITGAVATALQSFTPTSSVNLRIVVGPNITLTNRTAAAWGLGVGVDLAGSLGFNLLDLVTANVVIPTGISGANSGNLLDLRLAYSTCQSGVVAAATVPAVPPGLV
jgi:hypothetical protein